MDPVYAHEAQLARMQASLLLQQHTLRLAERKRDIELAKSLRMQPLPPKEQVEGRRGTAAARGARGEMLDQWRPAQTAMHVLRAACVARGVYLGSRLRAFQEFANQLAKAADESRAALRGKYHSASIEHIDGREFLLRAMLHVARCLDVPALHRDSVALALARFFVAMDSDPGDAHRVSVAGLQCGCSVLFDLAPRDAARATFDSCDYGGAQRLALRDVEWLFAKVVAAGQALRIEKRRAAQREWCPNEVGKHFADMLWAEACAPGAPYIERDGFVEAFAGLLRGDAHRARERAARGAKRSALRDDIIARRQAQAAAGAALEEAKRAGLSVVAAAAAPVAAAAAVELSPHGKSAAMVSSKRAESERVSTSGGGGAAKVQFADARAGGSLVDRVRRRGLASPSTDDARAIARNVLASGPQVAANFYDAFAAELDAADAADTGAVQRVAAGLLARDRVGAVVAGGAGRGVGGARPSIAIAAPQPVPRWHCEGIAPGSPAHRSGLQVGDAFVRLGYIVMADLEREERRGSNEVGLFMQLAAMGQVYGGEELDLVVRRRDSARHPWRRVHLRITPSTNDAVARGYERFGFTVGASAGALARSSARDDARAARDAGQAHAAAAAMRIMGSAPLSAPCF
jgi:hypothetical protein